MSAMASVLAGGAVRIRQDFVPGAIIGETLVEGAAVLKPFIAWP
jgi:hypothetical protein